MIQFAKEKIVQAALMLAVAVGTLMIVVIFKALRLKEEREEGPLYR